MPHQSVTVIDPPLLPTANDIHVSTFDIHVSTIHRALVQRAIFRAGYTTKVVFMEGDPVMVYMTGLPELHRGFSAVQYVHPAFEATLRNRMAAFEDQ